jgi:hypothetical protein
MASARKRAVAQLKAKEARQKKVLFALIPVFLLLVAWQGPKTFKRLQGPSAQPVPAAVQTTPTTTTPAPTETTPVETPGGELPETEVPPAAGLDQLAALSQFESKDPFVQQGGAAATGGNDGGGDAAAGSAVFDVNGTSETVSVGSQFPTADPTFVLVSVGDNSAVIGLVSGTFEGGQSTMELAVGQEIEFVADPDNTHYTIKLNSVG